MPFSNNQTRNNVRKLVGISLTTYDKNRVVYEIIDEPFASPKDNILPKHSYKYK